MYFFFLSQKKEKLATSMLTDTSDQSCMISASGWKSLRFDTYNLTVIFRLSSGEPAGGEMALDHSQGLVFDFLFGEPY